MSHPKRPRRPQQRDNENLIRRLFEHVSSGVAIYEAVDDGRDFVFLDFNSAGERIGKVRRTEVIGKRVADVFPGVEEFGLLDVFRRVWKTGDAEHHPIQYYEDGRIAGWRDNYVFKLPTTGNIVTIYDEPTELRGILDGLFGFVGIYLPNGVLVDANRAPLEAAGLTRKDVIGKPFWETPWWSHSPATQDQVRHALARAAAGETVREDFSVRLGPDTTIIIDASFAPLRDQAGNINRLIGFGVDITERKLAETALRESERRLAVAQRIAKIGNWEWDITTNDLHWSDEIYRVFGLTPKQFDATYEAFLATVHPDDRKLVENAVASALEDGVPYSIDHRIVMPSGEVRIVHEQAEVERDVAGTAIAMRGTVQDITERKLAEETAEHSAQRTRAILENVADAVITVDDRGKIESLNPAAERLFGYDADEIVGRAVSRLMTGDDRRRHAGYMRRHLETGKGTIIGKPAREVTARRKDGSTFSASLAVSVTEFGNRRLFIGALRDITDRKLAEQALRDSEARFRMIAEMAPAGIMITRALDGTILFCNPGFGKIIGADPEKLVGRRTGDLLGKGFGRQDVVSMVQLGHARNVELEIPLAIGGSVWVSFSASPMRLDGEDVILAIVNDDTERKHAVKELNLAKDEAELANRSKSEFLANMSHELRTPLNAILGFSEMMMKQTLGPIENETYRVYASDINASGRHLLALVNDLLDISKIEAGQLELVEAEEEIFALFESCVRIVREKLELKSIKFRMDLPDQLPLVICDQRAMKQVFFNLLSNAVKFTPEGGRISVSGRLTAESNLSVTVSDTGIGIAPHMLERVFQPFVQADGSMSRQYEGTGLGLAITKSLVEAHGGTLTLESKLGEGTSVTIKLPAARLTAADPRQHHFG